MQKQKFVLVAVSENDRLFDRPEKNGFPDEADEVRLTRVAGAYALIRELQPTLTVLDLNLENQEAFMLLSMLKLDPKTAELTVISITLPHSFAFDEESQDDDNTEEPRLKPQELPHYRFRKPFVH